MTVREFLQGRRKAEYPVFMTAANALPGERFDHTPHVRSLLGGSSASDVVVADDLKYRQKTGRAKKLPNRFPNVVELQSATCRFCGNIQPNQRTEARAVHLG